MPTFWDSLNLMNWLFQLAIHVVMIIVQFSKNSTPIGVFYSSSPRMLLCGILLNQCVKIEFMNVLVLDHTYRMQECMFESRYRIVMHLHLNMAWKDTLQIWLHWKYSHIYVDCNLHYVTFHSNIYNPRGFVFFLAGNYIEIGQQFQWPHPKKLVSFQFSCWCLGLAMWKGCFWVWPNNVKKKREGLGLRRREPGIPHGRMPVGLGLKQSGGIPHGRSPVGLGLPKRGVTSTGEPRGAWLKT